MMNKSYLIALSLTVILIVWMISGILDSEEKNAKPHSVVATTPKLSVQTAIQIAQDVQLSIKVQGYVESNRSLSLRSQIDSSVAEILVPNGALVKADTLLMRLNLEDRLVKLEKEKAILKAKQNAYTRISALAQSNFQSKNLLDEAFADLNIAKANLLKTELEITHTEIRAPFTGTLEKRMVEKGSYVTSNTQVATFVDNSQLIVVVPVAQQNIQKIALGNHAKLKLATGELRDGIVRYIAPRAEQNTRTFRVEIALDNPHSLIPSGTSAEAEIQTELVLGHFISPAILSLNDNGQMGVKTVDEKDTVVFNPIDIIRATTDGIWISGLPESANIITVGQGFVREGTEVVSIAKSNNSNQSGLVFSQGVR